MEKEITAFMTYLHNVKNTSENTEMSYRRDLGKVQQFMGARGITQVQEVSSEDLSDYVKYLEDHKFAAATVSRNIASIKAFYHFMMQESMVQEDLSEQLKAPKIEKKAPEIMSPEEVVRLLEQPSGETHKEIRDKAMLELLYATGMRVSELVHLSVNDLNLRYGWIICRDGERERMVPFGSSAGLALLQYMEKSREHFLKQKSTDALFLNCAGAPMSRQGFWKILKSYAKKAGIEKDITPRMLRHSCAAHMASNGAGLHTIREILGHADLAATQVYAEFQPENKTEYSRVHPRG